MDRRLLINPIIVRTIGLATIRSTIPVYVHVLTFHRRSVPIHLYNFILFLRNLPCSFPGIVACRSITFDAR